MPQTRAQAAGQAESTTPHVVSDSNASSPPAKVKRTRARKLAEFVADLSDDAAEDAKDPPAKRGRGRGRGTRAPATTGRKARKGAASTSRRSARKAPVKKSNDYIKKFAYGPAPTNINSLDEALQAAMDSGSTHWWNVSVLETLPKTNDEKKPYVDMLYAAFIDMQGVTEGKVSTKMFRRSGGEFIGGIEYIKEEIYIRCWQILEETLALHKDGVALSRVADPSWDCSAGDNGARYPRKKKNQKLHLKSYNRHTECFDIDEELSLSTYHDLSFEVRWKVMCEAVRTNKPIALDAMNPAIHPQKSLIIAPEKQMDDKRQYANDYIAREATRKLERTIANRQLAGADKTKTKSKGLPTPESDEDRSDAESEFDDADDEEDEDVDGGVVQSIEGIEATDAGDHSEEDEEAFELSSAHEITKKVGRGRKTATAKSKARTTKKQRIVDHQPTDTDFGDDEAEESLPRSRLNATVSSLSRASLSVEDGELEPVEQAANAKSAADRPTPGPSTGFMTFSSPPPVDTTLPHHSQLQGTALTEDRQLGFDQMDEDMYDLDPNFFDDAFPSENDALPTGDEARFQSDFNEFVVNE